MAYQRRTRRRTTRSRSGYSGRSYNRSQRRAPVRSVRRRTAARSRAPAAQRLIIQVEHTAPGEVARPSMPTGPEKGPRKAKF